MEISYIAIDFYFFMSNFEFQLSENLLFFQKMPTPCKTLLLEFLRKDVTGWAKYLKIDIRILRKLLNGTGTIRIETARSIMKRIDGLTGEKNDIENFFILSELQSYPIERTVIYEETENQLTKDDWISIVRYVIEKRFDAFSISDILLFIFILGASISTLIYFFL